MTTMTNTTKRIFAIALSGALLLPAMSVAEAGHRDGWRNNHGWHDSRRPHHGYKKKRKDNDVGAAVAAGIIGLAAGAILLGATSQPTYAAPAPSYYPPAPQPGNVYGGSIGYQPWSPAWYDYCTARYRSFNPRTGTFTTYSGEQKFCQ
ncbi:BA14K family protein [Roseibium sp.]|uniref:BA14K family protein n=1 Tax=Roseibium sp. TaxID=1936156 RepID=UPI003A975EED